MSNNYEKEPTHLLSKEQIDQQVEKFLEMKGQFGQGKKQTSVGENKEASLQQLSDLLHPQKKTSIDFAYWVDTETQKAALSSPYLRGLCKQLLESNSPNADKAWKKLFSEFISLKTTQEHIDGLHRSHILRTKGRVLDEIMDQLSDEALKSKVHELLSNNQLSQKELFKHQVDYFLHTINSLALVAGRPLHASQKLTNKDRLDKADQLEKALRKAKQLYRELGLESESLVTYRYPSHLHSVIDQYTTLLHEDISELIHDQLFEVLEKYLPGKVLTHHKFARELRSRLPPNLLSEPLLRAALEALNVTIPEIISDQFLTIEKLRNIESLPSPNSKSAIRNHFIKNWIEAMFYMFGAPMWDTSATITSILFSDSSSPEQIRDVCRKESGGKFLKHLKKTYSGKIQRI